jgi:thiamine-monophosphate kinase
MLNRESLDDLGEWGLIAALAARMPPGSGVTIGIGDDSAVVAAPGGQVAAAVDMFLEGSHFRMKWSSASDVGVKAAARSLADIAAMGAVPTALLVSLAAPGSLPASWALDLASALAAEAARAGASVVGGDTASASLVMLSVTALGSLPGRPVTRSGARAGDVVAISGRPGRSAAGLALLAAGLTAPAAPAAPSGPAAPLGLADLVAAHLRPAPDYTAGPQAASLGATSMIDTSDGLLSDLGHVADASGVTIDIRSSTLDVDSLLPAAAALAFDPLTWALNGGEDHALVATFPQSVSLPAGWRVIGEVHPGPSAVLVDGAPNTAPSGWQHFASPPESS